MPCIDHTIHIEYLYTVLVAGNLELHWQKYTYICKYIYYIFFVVHMQFTYTCNESRCILDDMYVYVFLFWPIGFCNWALVGGRLSREGFHLIAV